MALDGVVVEGDPFWPEREGLPEEGVDWDGAQEAYNEASCSCWNDDFQDGEALGEEEVERDGPNQDGQFGAENNAGNCEQIKTESISSVGVFAAV